MVARQVRRASFWSTCAPPCCVWCLADAFLARVQKEDPECKEAERVFNLYTYTELALGGQFGLIVEGFGYHSFRLTEVPLGLCVLPMPPSAI